jgi:predicted HicB family RNase H-like nuclease
MRGHRRASQSKAGDDTPDAIPDCRANGPESKQWRGLALTTTHRMADHEQTTTFATQRIERRKTMQDKFLKARIPRAVYDALQQRAGEAGQRIGTYVREVLERDAQAIGTEQALARIEAALASNAPPSVPVLDHNVRRELLELRLLLREIALHTNAQILTRVAAQLAAQTAPASGSGGAP